MTPQAGYASLGSDVPNHNVRVVGSGSKEVPGTIESEARHARLVTLEGLQHHRVIDAPQPHRAVRVPGRADSLLAAFKTQSCDLLKALRRLQVSH